jgi:hypothetical protein
LIRRKKEIFSKNLQNHNKKKNLAPGVYKGWAEGKVDPAPGIAQG